jgi:hypothetical protein
MNKSSIGLSILTLAVGAKVVPLGVGASPIAATGTIGIVITGTITGGTTPTTGGLTT